jgi:uncharacterized protein (UPF0332 family)
MTPDQQSLIRKARSSLAAAQLLLQEGYSEFAAARAYYTMFYLAQAFLLNLGLSFSKHSAVIAAFGREFVKSGIVPEVFHRYLIEAQEVRLIADYREIPLDAEEANLQIERAEEFLELAERLIGPVLPAD